MLSATWRLPVAWLTLLIMFAAGGGVSLAQQCTADVQCRNSGRPQARCSGDTLVVERDACSGGVCRQRTEQRRDCRAGERFGCRDGRTAERITARCVGSAGRCEERTERQACTEGCVCTGKRLVIATGRCSPSRGCVRTVLVCERGCTCAPEPKCL